MTNIVVLRGNSGSGKSTIAKELRRQFSGSTMIVSQDLIRRDILGVKDRPGNPSAELIYNVIEFGINKFDLIIVEGILNSDKYESMLERVIHLGQSTQFYYFQMSFEATYKRHLSKNTHDFGIEELNSWWVQDDFLNIVESYLIYEDSSIKQTIATIIERLPSKQI